MEKKIKYELLKKEIVDELRSLRGILVIIFTNFVILACVCSMFRAAINSWSNGYATNYKAVLYMYNNLIFIVFIVTLIIIPFMAGASYAREYEKGTLELLLLSKLKTSDMIFAKINKILIYNLIIALSTLPMISVVFSVGGVGIGDIIKYLMVIYFTSWFFASIGLYISVKLKSTVKSILCITLIEVILVFGINFTLKFAYNIADRIINKDFYGNVKGASYNEFQFENMGNVLIVNPLYDIYKLQSEIVGHTSSFDKTMNNYGVNPSVEKIWLFISIFLKVIVGWLFVRLTKKTLFRRHNK